MPPVNLQKYTQQVSPSFLSRSKAFSQGTDRALHPPLRFADKLEPKPRGNGKGEILDQKNKEGKIFLAQRVSAEYCHQSYRATA